MSATKINKSDYRAMKKETKNAGIKLKMVRVRHSFEMGVRE